MDFFPSNSSSDLTDDWLFEKSATYFDRDFVPLRAHRLLKDAKLVAIIISPAKRAYSWYQHVLAHNDPVAQQHSFYDVITAPKDAPKPLRNLQSRCLEPGKYVSHFERWLTYYNSQQLTIIDGEELKTDPVSVMNKLQYFLSVKPTIDYAEHLKYDAKKGFFCPVRKIHTCKHTIPTVILTISLMQIEGDRLQCLGKGKGRQYSPLDIKSLKYLQDYYRLYNEALLKLLKRLGYKIPVWLQDDLRDAPQSESE